MPNVLAVFIGQKMRKNFDTALGSGKVAKPSLDLYVDK